MSGLTDKGVELHPLGTPTALDNMRADHSAVSATLTPEQHIYLYDDRRWEEFILEWATSFQPPYVQVMRSGGANDHGVDVAGFATSRGFDDAWDCYQCKHYSSALTPSDAHPEILKVVRATLAEHYTWPRSYRFAAPQGIGTTLANLIHSPSRLKAAFIQQLTKNNSALVKQLGQFDLAEILAYVDGADFSIFGTVELHELVEQHSRTRWHTTRFGVSLPARPIAPLPTAEPASHEQHYIEKLIAAYIERHGGDINPLNAAEHHHVGGHYVRHRVAFYSAETLRAFSRDSVPEGTFDALQNEIFDGVVDTHELEHRDGLERLHRVTEAARALAITANDLLPVLEVRDRTGICHQLANDGRLTWCKCGQ